MYIYIEVYCFRVCQKILDVCNSDMMNRAHLMRLECS